MKVLLPKFLTLTLAFSTVLGFLATAAHAEKISEVTAQTSETSVYVGSERDDIDKQSLIDALQTIRSDADKGLKLIAVAPNDPQPSAQAFARRVQEDTGAEAVLVFSQAQDDNPELKAYVKSDPKAAPDSYPNSLKEHQTCALENASKKSSQAEAAKTFAKELRGGCSSGLSSGFFLLFFLIASVIAAFWVVLVIENKRKRARMEKARNA